jgi:hypothetical protein
VSSSKTEFCRARVSDGYKQHFDTRSALVWLSAASTDSHTCASSSPTLFDSYRRPADHDDATHRKAHQLCLRAREVEAELQPQESER